jgi:hypothetical protein
MARNQGKENAQKRGSGHKVADAVNQADADALIVGYQRVSHFFNLADGSTATTTYTLRHKEEIVDVLIQKRAANGGASDTIQLKDGSDNVITDAISININDKTRATWTTIDDAFSTLAAGATLKVVKTKASGANVACLVEVVCIRRA